ncbi:transglycosylase SLT domain-containing protein [Acinetobacter sp. MD2(2019)]|uniref:transglycosylase SLT domain-containing protein n=1 Tax=Acinetobacter sp. MD2(2019) TaxID=2605273 RepID=UPI002D1E94AC|nr:transglycosylase SLT domain-containing protein [Acinetobacter sp. MD2(2019)]MEB3754049.1 transglycosylase SLT domain-containing protein [Acinetobacter sp. MD2(2019)]
MNTHPVDITRRLRLKNLFTSLPIQLLTFSAAMLPFTLNATKPASQYDEVMHQKTLTVVAVRTSSTVFEGDQYSHGFGYDLVRNYAQSLNVNLKFEVVNDNTTALQWVAKGKANLALTNADLNSIEQRRLTTFSVGCGDEQSLEKNGLDANLNLVFKSADDPLTQTASGYICQAKQTGALNHLASFYNHNVVSESSWDSIEQDLKQRMPIYQASFKRAANEYDLDWQLLAAMGYQESYLKPNSISPTGVRGLMMLTANTAKAMGIQNRNDPEQSIHGGAKYFDQLLDQYQNIPVPDRYWFALVAYNMGPGAVSIIQQRLEKQGKNPNNWVDFYAYLQQHKAGNSRYIQALQYVVRIRAYLEHIQNNEVVDV